MTQLGELLRAVSPLLVFEIGVFLASFALLTWTLRWSLRSSRRLQEERERRARELAREEERIRDLEQEAATSWAGYRKFQVVSRVDEDVRGQMASFELMPFHRAALTLSGEASPADLQRQGEGGREPDRLPRFRPGQYVQVRFDIPGQANLVTRCYSLSKPYQPDRYRITVGRMAGTPDPVTGAPHPPGIVSNYLLDHVRERAVLDVTVPQGDFGLDPTRPEPVVLVGWGIHAAPMLAMFEASAQSRNKEVWLFLEVTDSDALPKASLRPLIELAQQPGRSNVHLWISFGGNESESAASQVPQTAEEKTAEEEAVAARPEEQQAFRSRPLVYREGRQSVAWIKRALPAQFRTTAEFFVSGPALMLREAKHDLESWGISEERVHFEVFDREGLDAISSAEEESGACEVSFEASKKQATWDPEARNLLGLAAANKVRIASTCKIGKCGECEVLLVSGKVRYPKPPDWKIKQGHCLPCVASPASSNVVLGA